MPSTLLLSIDCLRADHVGCYGYDRPTTPNIDSFAKDATRYKYSYANSPGTRWAFQSVHTGLHTGQIDGLGIPKSYTDHLARQFQDAGYATGGFAYNGFLSQDYRYNNGFDHWCDVSYFDHQNSVLTRTGKTIANKVNSDILQRHVFRPAYNILTKGTSASEYRPPTTDTDVVDKALIWLQERQSEPGEYFTWIHFMDAHTPYGRYNKHLHAIRGDTNIDHVISPRDENVIAAGEEPKMRVIDTYDACIRSVDEQLGRIFNIIDDDTIVVIMGDHGEEFGRYGEFHEASLYSSMTEVPIIIKAPELELGLVEDHFAQHVDIAPTLLYASNISTPERYVGNPLQIVDRDLSTPTYFSLSDVNTGIQTDKWKLIRNRERTLAFEMSRDEREQEQLPVSAVPDNIKTSLDRFNRQLVTNRVGGGAADLDSDDDLSDNVERNLSDLGYIE